MGRSRRVVVALVSIGFVTAACGGDNSGSQPTTTAASPGPASTPVVAGPTSTATSATATSAAPTTTTVPPPKTGGKLTVRVEAEVGNPWTPANMQCDAACYVRARTFFETPMVIDAADKKPKPYLAESVTHNADYTAWTMKLRPNISFTDGTPLNADAVLDNSARVKKSLLLGAAVTDIEDTKKIDDLTVEYDMKRPWVTFDYALTTQGAFAASPTWLAAVDADPAKATQPVGTGPFILDTFRAGDETIVKKNPNYWRKAEGLPYLDEIDFKVVADDLTAGNAMATGEFDLMHTKNGDNIKRFKTDSKVDFEAQTDFVETNYILFNVGQEGSPLQDQQVRCGLAAATDAQTLIDTVGAGQFPLANGLFSPGQQGHLDDNGNQKYDPAKAKELIGAWSAAHGGQKPHIVFSTTTDSTALQTAQLLQQWWQAAGAEVDIVQLDQSKLITNALLGDPQFMAFGWRNHNGYVLDNQYFWWHSSQALPPGQLALNFGRLKDPVIDQLLDDAHTNLDLTKGETDGEAVNRQFAKECWVIPISWQVWGLVSKPTVHGLDQATFPGGTGTLRNSFGTFWLQNVWVG
ncbi:MAG TPA: ABC transporter substrate-binding protein [Acidimicrobiales bacterium]